MKFKNIPKTMKPRERLINKGVKSLSDAELMAIVLQTGTKNKNVLQLSLDLLGEFGGLSNIKNVKYNNLLKIDGIGRAKATLILSIIELGSRMYREVSIEDVIECANPRMIVNYFYEEFLDKKQEEFYVIYLDNKKKYLDKKLLFKGSINYSVVHPREIFKEAYLLSASSIICIHNHPSGDVTPSDEDDNITKRIYDIGIMHDIKLVDHIIIGKDSYYSYFENGKIK